MDEIFHGNLEYLYNYKCLKIWRELSMIELTTEINLNDWGRIVFLSEF